MEEVIQEIYKKEPECYCKYSRGKVLTDENSSYSVCISESCNKLDVHDWLKDIPASLKPCNIVEIRFKNTRKGFYLNVNSLLLKKGDIVAVEASPGHDIGIVSLTGELVMEQIGKCRINSSSELKKIYRKAKPVDVEKWQNAISQEDTVMLQARKISEDLKLNMKIGDVEFQGDGTKAIFYYIAEERVDFRELIKVLAERFKIRVEMKQIGARQEAGRIGGIASCGRELCCSTWITNFISVTTNSARYQELSLNPQKLAGQCGKLKCCLNYEFDCYMDVQRDFPDKNITLESEKGTAYHQKTDIFKRIMWYSFDPESSINMVSIPVDRVKKIIEFNKKGIKVKDLIEEKEREKLKENADFQLIVGQDSVTRFDDKSPRLIKKKKKKHHRPEDQNRERNTAQPTEIEP